MTRLSVTIPPWNGLRDLPTCLEALRAQLRPGDEITVVDDGLRDGSGAWMRTYTPDVDVLTLPMRRMAFAKVW